MQKLENQTALSGVSLFMSAKKFSKWTLIWKILSPGVTDPLCSGSIHHNNLFKFLLLSALPRSLIKFQLVNRGSIFICQTLHFLAPEASNVMSLAVHINSSGLLFLRLNLHCGNWLFVCMCQ